jgi:hypothetical protein
MTLLGLSSEKLALFAVAVALRARTPRSVWR